MGAPLSPFVLWAQTETEVTLRVDVRDAEETDFDCAPETVGLACRGKGARGENRYAFRLDLYAPVDPDDEGTRCQRYESRLQITLRKTEPTWWPRLTKQLQKPLWLKLDFDRWKSEEDAEEERRDIMADHPEAYGRLHKEEMGYMREDLKKVYLVCYNLFQFVGFLFIVTVTAVRYFKYGSDSMSSTYEHVGSALKFVQLLQFLEVMHPLFGYTKGGIIQPFFQVTGRAILLFAMIEAEPRMQTKPVVFYLILMWSTIELVRYPYYISQLYKKDIYLLTWLRYSLWIPLYPLGIICEGVIILRNIPYFEETQRFTVSLPNRWNFAFHTPTAMRVYLLFLFIPGLYTMLTHMYRSRVSKLSSYKKVVIKKSR